MKINIIEEHGFESAMRGLARSFNQDVSKMPKVALNLANKDGGHNKFLESMTVCFDLEAPLFFWTEFDTYRVGMTKQSDSTMHTLKRQPLTQDNFEYPIYVLSLRYINMMIEADVDIDIIKNELHCGFLQGRTCCTNYKVLRNIILQRRNHKLPQWLMFCDYMMRNLKYAEYLGVK